MASLELDPASGRFRVRFRYAGQAFKRSLCTKQHRVALASLGQVEETLRMLELCLVDLPAKVEPGEFIVSGARSRREQRPQSPVRTLADLFRVYEAELPAGAKEERTLEGERLHVKNMLRHLKASTAIATVSTNVVQRYVELRSKDQFRGRMVGPDTIKKELSTLRLVWNWAKKQGYVDAPPPVDRIVYPKRDEKPPFMTLAEIERRLKGATAADRRRSVLWEALYLTRADVGQLLATVHLQMAEPFVYPLFVLAAHTGMRRSELVRAEASDFDFAERTVLVREKKRSRKHALSFRRIPMTALVERVFCEHLAKSPGGRYAFHRPAEPLLSEDTATNHFKAALRGTPWDIVRGFHVFRHSFASNAATEGVDQRMIDEWMGHQTEEMRRRYRHLAPSQQQAALDSVYR